MKSLVRRLLEALAQVKDEQSYIVVRERVHRNTAESTNARVKWWSIFQLAVLIGEGIFQVWWLKRFFEVCLPFVDLLLSLRYLHWDSTGQARCLKCTFHES
jgi:hypothetical protein